DGIAGDDEPNARDMQTRRKIGVRVTELHGDQFMSLERDDVSHELVRNYQPVGYRTWETRLPLRTRLRGGVVPHHAHRAACGERFGVGESLEQGAQSEPMISAAMRDVDRR